MRTVYLDLTFINLTILQWLNTQVMGWLRTIFDGDQGETSSGQSSSQTLSKWNERLTYFLYQTYAKLRIRELFNIIVEYPDSHPALEDLKESLRKTDLRSRLIQSLRVAMETRLLHPGMVKYIFLDLMVPLVYKLLPPQVTGYFAL